MYILRNVLIFIIEICIYYCNTIVRQLNIIKIKKFRPCDILLSTMIFFECIDPNILGSQTNVATAPFCRLLLNLWTILAWYQPCCFFLLQDYSFHQLLCGFKFMLTYRFTEIITPLINKSELFKISMWISFFKTRLFT